MERENKQEHVHVSVVMNVGQHVLDQLAKPEHVVQQLVRSHCINLSLVWGKGSIEKMIKCDMEKRGPKSRFW